MSVGFCVHNLGCKVNRVESDSIALALAGAGGRPVVIEQAALVLINTCTVTGEAEAKTRKAIRQALAAPLRPWVVATGCAIAINRDGFAALGERVVAEPDRNLAKQRALQLLGLTERKSDGLSNEIGMNTRRGIKIQDGCDNDCSYCIVRIARGGASSVPAAAVAQQLRAAEAAGVREAVLTGVNIGAYHDQGAGLHLPELLEELLAGTDQLRIRLSSLEPQHASDRLLQLISASPGRVCAHLHLPLQSGSNHTLLAMRRRYDTAQFAERVSLARDLMPRLALTTDVIVGFPGERDQDFADSLEFCRSLRFSKVHVFRFSCRPQTEAAALAGQVDAATISKRAKAMRELAAQMRQQDQQRRLDTSEYVLVERRGRGTSESYHQVETPPDAVIGSLSLMRFVGCRDNLLLGSLAHSK